MVVGVIVWLLWTGLSISSFSSSSANFSDKVTVLPAPAGNKVPGFTSNGETYQQSLTFNGTNRTYLLHLPPATAVKGPLPLVLAFHGAGENAYYMASRGLSTEADQKGFIVVYPDGTNPSGNPAEGFTWNSLFCCGSARQSNVDDVGFIKALINQLEKNYSIDKRRIYATGFSNGGMFSYLLAARLSDTIAAIAPVSAEFRSDAKPTESVPVLAINGKEDKVVSYKNAAEIAASWASYNNCQSPSHTEENNFVSEESYCPDNLDSEVVFYTIKAGGHEWFQVIRTVANQDISSAAFIWNFFATHPKD